MICLASHWSGACTNQPMGKQVMTQIGGSWNPLDDASAIAVAGPTVSARSLAANSSDISSAGVYKYALSSLVLCAQTALDTSSHSSLQTKRLTATDRLPILPVLPLAPTAIPLLGCQSANRLPPRPLARNFPNNPEYQRNSNGVQAFDMLRQECRVHLRYVLILRLCLLRSLRSTVSYISKSL